MGDDAEPAQDAALLAAVVDVVRASHAMEQARDAAEETRLALLSMFQARLPAHAAEIDTFLMDQAGPQSAGVQAFAEAMVANMAQLLVENFTLAELVDFEAFQRTEEFQDMAPDFAAQLQRPLRTFQDDLIRAVNDRFH
jgi:hypothetical protein